MSKKLFWVFTNFWFFSRDKSKFQSSSKADKLPSGPESKSVSRSGSRNSKGSEKEKEHSSPRKISKPKKEKKSKNTVEDLIAESIKILDTIKDNRYDDNVDSKDPEFSPIIDVGISDTWGNDTQLANDTMLELAKDFNDLQLQYKLRENWLESSDRIKKPFKVDLSVIQTHHKA